MKLVIACDCGVHDTAEPGRPHVCRSCGRVVDVDCAVGATPCLTAADDSDYEIDEAEVVYWGRCPKCLAAAPVP